MTFDYHDWCGEHLNVDRGHRVGPAVAEYARDHYFGGEELEVVVGDMIGDLLHYLNEPECHIGLPDHVNRSPDYHGARHSADMGVRHYIEELDIEAYNLGEARKEGLI